MSVERVKDRKDEDIHEGDHVWTRYRGGVREGDVSTIPILLIKFEAELFFEESY
jgi:hypothetical protein